MATAAPDLIWACVKKNSCFIRKSIKGQAPAAAPTLSAEPGNLGGVHSFKFSSLANSEVLGIDVKSTGKKDTIIVTTRSRKGEKLYQPRKFLAETGLPKCSKKGVEKLKKTIAGKYNRQDLLDLALTKYSKIRQSFKKNKRPVKSRRVSK
eukprot:TRINITY_DN79645_c0_g1_i1.p2 TRINITY_DN79645_c0_g1~~TRINITY_DN79645_c0_g1_i1.p2  ORF type:complete len:150 (+),score=30.61 TRINITY_DN79645_c0_g1_i1:79-528(+)